MTAMSRIPRRFAAPLVATFGVVVSCGQPPEPVHGNPPGPDPIHGNPPAPTDELTTHPPPPDSSALVPENAPTGNPPAPSATAPEKPHQNPPPPTAAPDAPHHNPPAPK